MNQVTFKSNFTALGEYFNKPQSEALAKIYWRKLKHLTDEQFESAVSACLDDCKFFPKIPEITERSPKALALENKGSLNWCQNTDKLLALYSEKAREAI